LGDKVVQKNILLTGPPGCGKSTIIEKIVQRINLPCTGFFTREMREKGRRVGFSIATLLDGRRGIMAHIDIQSRYRVGKYGVDLQSIDTIAVPSMVAENDNVVVVVDEIGKMECFSAMFRQSLLRVLESPNTVVGSIALKGDAFINAIKKRPDSRLISVSEKNRDVLAEEVLSSAKQGVTNQMDLGSEKGKRSLGHL
jgi:nucleoside-triphosphatase